MLSQGSGWYHLGAPEVRVRAMQVIKNAEDAEALVELKVMEVVRLVGGEEWEVVARVRVDGVHRDEGAPQPHFERKVVRTYTRKQYSFKGCVKQALHSEQTERGIMQPGIHSNTPATALTFQDIWGIS